MNGAASMKDMERRSLQTAAELQRVSRDSLYKRFKALDYWGRESVIGALLRSEERMAAERKQGLSLVHGGRE